MSFESALEKVLPIEGGYSDNKNDAGGKTNFGITEMVARANGYDGEMSAMPLSVAQTIYRAEYWDKLRLDDVAEDAPDVADKLFDIAVNCGQGVAGKFLQRVLNAMNDRGRFYSDITVDGGVGRATIVALRAYLDKRGPEGAHVLLEAIDCLQGERYISLAEKNEQDQDFVYGWIKNRIEL